MMLLAYAGFTMAQNTVIENYEPIKMSTFDVGANGSLLVVPNPDPTGANTSAYVCKMVIGIQGRQPHAGWYSTIAPKIDVTANRYLHIKVWKPRISPTCFKVEKSGNDSGDTFPMAEYSDVGKWQEIVFDWTTSPNTPKPAGEYEKIVLIPDFEKPYLGTEDVTLYFDDMYVNNDPAVGSAPVQVIENFEFIPMTRLSDDNANDATKFGVIANPDRTPFGANVSHYVLDFTRDKDAVEWTGFWAPVPNVDVTTNKYVHVKLWKPRLSVVKFKIQDGAAGTLEIASMNAQTKINAWEDFVFDFSGKTGTYPIIALLVDVSNVALTEDSHIYVDDIIVNSDPNPKTKTEQIIQVDMNGAGLVAGDKVYIAGALGDIYGTWNEPGTNPNNQMTDPDGDGIYTLSLSLPDGLTAFKFFVNGWGKGDPFTGGDRTYNIDGNVNIIYTWGVGGVETSVRENKLAGKIQMYPNPVRNELTVNSTSDIRKVIITNTLGKVVGNVAYSSNKTINTSNLSKGMYFVTFIGADGTKATQKLIKD